MSEQYPESDGASEGAPIQEARKKHDRKMPTVIGSCLLVGAVAAGAIEYFVFYKPDTAQAQDIGDKKLTVGLELGQLGFQNDLLMSISNFETNKKGIVTGKANTGDKQYPNCDVTYDMTFDPSKNSVTFKLPAVRDAAGNAFGEFEATTTDDVKTRTTELCVQQAANAAKASSSASPTH